MTAIQPLRILFAGTPDFAVVPLQELVNQGLSPIAVLTQPDRPAGRGREARPSPVKQAAIAAGIPVHQPFSLSDEPARGLVASLAPDLMIVVAYGLLLPAEILAIPTFGCWNIHASLLPRWRGAAPIQRAIEAGDRETGVSIMQMDQGLDTGPVIHRARMPLDGSETAASLHDNLAVLGARALLHCLRRLAAGERLQPVNQPETGASYARKLDKNEAQLDWSEPADVLERRIRAFNPWPVAWCLIGSERTRIWRASCTGQHSSGTPGTVLSASSQGIDVATGRGTLRLLEIQPPGKRRMGAADYLNARSLPDRLGTPS
jgi:methionyl-tRNA formyltransferase